MRAVREGQHASWAYNCDRSLIGANSEAFGSEDFIPLKPYLPASLIPCRRVGLYDHLSRLITHQRRCRIEPSGCGSCRSDAASALIVSALPLTAV